MAQRPTHFLSRITHTRKAQRGYTIFSLFVAALCSLYLEFTFELAGAWRTGISAGLFEGGITEGSILRFAIFFLAIFIILALISRSHVAELVVKHRYALSAALLVLLVVFEISGSSISLWGPRLGEDPFNGTLFGIPRLYRSDEWSVFTPFAFSQSYTANHAVSEVIRGCATDITMVYAQPSWSVATLFRPFLWGYLVLGAAKGLSFFWCARAIALVLVSYECMLLVTGGRRRIAAYAAILVGFAPIVEWWFAVNGTAELFIFGQGLVLALHYLLRTRCGIGRLGWSALLSWLLGCYAMIIYPSWQIPLVYVFGFMGIADLFLWAKQTEAGKRLAAIGKVALALVPCFAVSVGLMGLSIANAWEAMQSVMHTAYPGSRFLTGGGLLPLLANPLVSTLAPLWPEAYAPNVCEASAFASLFPLGIALAVYALVRGLRRGGVDTWIVCLLIPYAILVAYGTFGFPPILAKLSLLSNVQAGRLPLALGYVDVVLLARALTCAQEGHRNSSTRGWSPATRWVAVAGATAAIVAAMLAISVAQFPDLMHQSHWAFVLLGATTAVLVVPVLLAYVPSADVNTNQDSTSQSVWLLASATVVLVAGLCVNPLQRGADALLQSHTLQTIENIVQNNPDAIWLTDSSESGQATITVGAPTITSVNVYPNLERWRALDKDGTSEGTYNRYAHIQIALGETTSFENPVADVLKVTIAPDDVPKLGATYWLSLEDLAQWNTERTRFVPFTTAGPYTVFRIEGSS